MAISHKLLALSGALLALPAASNASIIVSSTTYGFAPPAGPGALIDFDAPLPAGFTLTGAFGDYAIVNGDSAGSYAAPAISGVADDTTDYLTVFGGGSATLLGTASFSNVSLYWGSIDVFNFLDLLDSGGNVITTIGYTDIDSAGSGNQISGNTNRRVDIASTTPIYGLKFRSNGNSFETDNVKFFNAVPEPTTWAMMIVGFGFVGGAMRRRRAAPNREVLA
jgi:hypothetical protein